jgi:O-antigen/teichoic acid export membrane protein
MLVLALGGVCLFIAFTGDWLAVLVFGGQFHGTGGILLALALGTVVSSLGLAAGNGLWAVDRPRDNFVGDIVCMSTTLTMAALLIPRFSVLGAALANLAGMTAGAVARMVVLQRYLNRAAGEECVASSSVSIRTHAHAASIHASDAANAGSDLQLTSFPEAVT